MYLNLEEIRYVLRSAQTALARFSVVVAQHSKGIELPGIVNRLVTRDRGSKVISLSMLV